MVWSNACEYLIEENVENFKREYSCRRVGAELAWTVKYFEVRV